MELLDVFVCDGACARRKYLAQVEVARTPQQLQRGYMYRDDIRQGTGMLFVMPKLGPRHFHMHNVRFPLDLVFLRADEDGNGWMVVDTYENARPNQQWQVESRVNAQHVLELPAGTIADYGIRRNWTTLCLYNGRRE